MMAGHFCSLVTLGVLVGWFVVVFLFLDESDEYELIDSTVR